jgi:hypothetical protein
LSESDTLLCEAGNDTDATNFMEEAHGITGIEAHLGSDSLHRPWLRASFGEEPHYVEEMALLVTDKQCAPRR